MLKIRQRFRRVSWRFAHQGSGELLRGVAMGLVLIASGIAFAALSERLGSSSLAMGHIMAATSCREAQALNLAPAVEGNAGYYDYLDLNADGVSCNTLAEMLGSEDLARRHLAAAASCAAARAQGLAPAIRGAAGYYAAHDADGDGIACEPYRGRR